MTKNYEVLEKNPLTGALPNLGVAKVDQVHDEAAIAALRFELQSFVCEGAYQEALDRILASFLGHIGNSQPAAWVGGFYGSGKSHLVKVLSQLWRNDPLPDGATPRGLVNVPQGVSDQLRELDAAAKRAGGLWSAAGIVNIGTKDINEVFLTILLESAGLPTDLERAACVMWLEDEGLLDAVQSEIASRGLSWDTVLKSMFVSELAEAVLAAKPGWATSAAAARSLLSSEFKRAGKSVTVNDVLAWTERILVRVSGDSTRLPLVLVVLDEVQQFIGDNASAAADVQSLVEACSSAFGGQLIVVATGQSALGATPTLQKLIDRFSVEVQLSDQDVDRVVREVVLRKQPAKVAEVEAVLDSNAGEVSRHLAGARIAPGGNDAPYLSVDYPILPSRRRFIEAVLHGVDDSGRAGKLRTQLRMIHDAVQDVAEKPLGFVVPADFVFFNQAADMVTTGAMSREIYDLILGERENSDRGLLRSRVLATVFLISKLPRGGFKDPGVRPNQSHIADLMVDDLKSSGAALREQVPGVLETLCAESKLQRVDDEYQLQSKTGQEWAQAFQVRRKSIADDLGRVSQERAELLQAAMRAKVPSQHLQGASKEARKIELSFGDVAPTPTDSVAVWCRNGWDVQEAVVKGDAEAAGPESPTVFIFVPESDAQDLKDAIVDSLAAREVMEARAKPTEAEGVEALKAMTTIQTEAAKRVDALVRVVVENARVMQGGGTTVTGGALEVRISDALAKSVSRLFPKFSSADLPNWHLVLGKAIAGDADPLKPVGGSTDAKVSTVLKEVKSRISGAGTQGKTVIDGLTKAPFGWTKDALQGSIAALAAQGLVTVHIGGAAATVKDLKASNIGTSTFKLEGEAVDIQQRMAARGVLSLLKIPFTNNEEAPACLFVANAVSLVASEAGGPPPLPLPGATDLVDELAGKAGNDLLRAVAKSAPDIKEAVSRWSKLADLREPRLRSFHLAESLVKYEEPTGGEHTEQLMSIASQRRALDEVDPFTSIITTASDRLRQQLKNAHAEYSSANEAALARLALETDWQSVDDDQRVDIVNTYALVPLSEPDVSTSTSILAALAERSLSHWSDTTESVENRASKALLAAIKINTPEAHSVKLPSKTLTSPDQVNAYVENVRAVLMAEFDTHSSIVVGG